ncbi:Mbeg1-like protein [Stomatobaculum longum]|uniref:Mbeg1-like protein n=1 Tax=Stomatobaculum longum TaxID=796942 RepID=UPI0028DB4453|nr:Mbeg1-like protein [Stomatobaculum longum]
MELFDYLKWRNDVSLRAAPFNEIDNVLLSYLAYADFGELLQEEKRRVSIETCFKRFCKKHDLANVRESKLFIERAPLLLEDMVCGARFRGTKVVHFREVFDKEKVQQFAALVFLLPDGTRYVSFRGTDLSITGWKEDFLMSFTAETEGAKEAVSYLNEVSACVEGDLILGGHSKGGNFAMFAAAFCDDAVKERILKVYNNDGPGFREEIVRSAAYRELLPKITNIVPQTSIIGRLLSNEAAHTVVKSTAAGIFQHDVTTWEVTKDKFVRAEPDAFSDFVEKSLGTWLETMDDEARKSLVETVFSMIEMTEAETFAEFGENLFKNTGLIIKGLGRLPKEKRSELTAALGGLAEAGRATVLDKIPKITLPGVEAKSREEAKERSGQN